MKKSSSLYILLASTALSLSSCQLPSSVSDVWPENWSDEASQKQTQKQTSQQTAPSSSPNTTSSETPAFKAHIKPTSKVVVPPSYYLAKGQPVSHQTSDNTWIEKQDASGYTIQLTSNSSAPTVAKTLQQAPKDARMAQVQYDNNGQAEYIGVYGSYPTQEAAQAALAKLPQNLQSAASVKSWSNIQDKVESSSEPSSSSEESSIAPPDITDN